MKTIYFIFALIIMCAFMLQNAESKFKEGILKMFEVSSSEIVKLH